MSQHIIVQSKKYVAESLNSKSRKEYTYHNMEHTTRVVNAAGILGEEADLSMEDRFLLIVAAIYHDVGYCDGCANHEIKSVEMAQSKLKELGVSKEKIDRISELIMATKMDWEGDDTLSRLLRDADMSGLADASYMKISEDLRTEKSFIHNKKIEVAEWINQNIDFFKSQKYLTSQGKKLYKKGKRNNFKILKRMKSMYDSDLLTIASSKSAQTQLKTALRNHIDLSAIADNKANIMLSVNAIVITVGIPLMLDKIEGHRELILPTIWLGLCCVFSMMYATFSTRPKRMAGSTDLKMIPEKKTNLFFFGNFYKMNFEEYERGMKEVVADNEVMDNSITRDLFFLGKILGVKFDNLRLCYNIFMAGIIGAAISLIGGLVYHVFIE